MILNITEVVDVVDVVDVDVVKSEFCSRRDYLSFLLILTREEER